ncbi:surface-adhesin E family protein [Herbaspirillum sp. NPDC101396]|uniref:surface-adhesin E family protein n=1 Tax=Herbaspirillum sp. NPDC101396 TaxID=3364005 RepID=UPI00383B2821
MKTLKMVVALCLGLISINVQAATDWQVITYTDSYVVAIDKNSIASTGAYKKGWVLYDYQSEQASETPYQNKKYKSALYLQYVNCPEKTLASKEELLYSGNQKQGEVVSTRSGQLSSEAFREIVPDSIGEAIFDYLCKARTQAKSRK